MVVYSETYSEDAKRILRRLQAWSIPPTRRQHFTRLRHIHTMEIAGPGNSTTVSFRLPGLPSNTLSASGFGGLPPCPAAGPRLPMCVSSQVNLWGYSPQNFRENLHATRPRCTKIKVVAIYIPHGVVPSRY